MKRRLLTIGATVAGAAALAVGGLAAFTASTARRVERALPPSGEFIEIDGARLHYVDRGSGPAILMIHGLAGQTGNFTHSLTERLTDDFRVIAVDRPGAGYSTRPAGAPAGVRAQARVIADFIAALGLERPFVVGHSLGGAIALALALDFPEAVSGIALIAPYTRASSTVPDAFKALAIRSPFARFAVAHTIAVPLSIATRGAVLAAIFGPDTPPSDFAKAGGGLLSLRPAAFITASEDLIASNRDMRALRDAYASLAVPVSVLFGTGDNVLDHAIHGVQLRDDFPHIELTLIEGGHMLPVTAPHATASWIRERFGAVVR